jgi:hypothetical protein
MRCAAGLSTRLTHWPTDQRIRIRDRRLRPADDSATARCPAAICAPTVPSATATGRRGFHHGSGAMLVRMAPYKSLRRCRLRLRVIGPAQQGLAETGSGTWLPPAADAAPRATAVASRKISGVVVEAGDLIRSTAVLLTVVGLECRLDLVRKQPSLARRATRPKAKTKSGTTTVTGVLTAVAGEIMPNTSLASTATPRDPAECSQPVRDHQGTSCPAWCAVQPERGTGAGHVAHRAAIWELPDRAELCVMQIVSDDPADIVAANLPTLYFWSADDAKFSDAECAEMAYAIRRAGELLCGVNGVQQLRPLSIG